MRAPPGGDVRRQFEVSLTPHVSPGGAPSRRPWVGAARANAGAIKCRWGALPMAWTQDNACYTPCISPHHYDACGERGGGWCLVGGLVRLIHWTAPPLHSRSLGVTRLRGCVQMDETVAPDRRGHEFGHTHGGRTSPHPDNVYTAYIYTKVLSLAHLDSASLKRRCVVMRVQCLHVVRRYHGSR